MKILFCVLATVFGLFGFLAVLRTIERLATGGGILPAQVLIAFVALALAVVCLRKARGGVPLQK